MADIQTFIAESRTPELAICARWRANAFSVLKASFEQELRSLELRRAALRLAAGTRGDRCMPAT
jgi:hypothetical protein